jgi:putative ABC transport system permease protein
MKLRDFRIGWRLLLKEPVHSAVVIFGLAVGFAVFYLLLGFVQQSMSYDRQFPHSEQIYVVKTRFNYNGPGAPWKQTSAQVLKDVLDKSGIQAESAGFVTSAVSMVVDRVPQEIGLTLVHPGFQRVFGLAATEGDLADALSRPDALALTASTARRLFNDGHAVGKTVQIDAKTYRVLAVLPDPSTTTTFPFEALAGNASTTMSDEARKRLYASWGLLNGSVFVRLPASLPPSSVEALLQDAVDKSPLVAMMPPELAAKLAGGKLMDVRLSPLVGAYLDPDIAPDNSLIAHGNLAALQALSAVALLILLLAATNYVNLATVRTLRRQREIAVRKVMGASVPRVVGQFVAESVLVSLMSGVLGVAIAFALRPSFSGLVNRRLDDLFGPGMLGIGLLVALLVGLVSGAYPTWVALKIRASQALSGRADSETAGGLWIRRVLTVLQFGTAIGLCAVTTAIAWQTNFATQLDPGFDPKPMLIVDMPKGLGSPQSGAFRDAVARLPEVAGVTAAWDAVGRHRTHLVAPIRREGGDSVSVEVKGVRPDFFEVYAIAPKHGRLFDAKRDADDSGSVVVNASAALALGYPTPDAAVGQALAAEHGQTPARIIGIAPDIRFESLRKRQEPLLYDLDANTRTLTVRARGDALAVQAPLEQLWQKYFPNDVMRVTRAQSFFDQEYADERRMSRTLAASTIVAFLIASFGIYVLAAYSVQRRAQEIVLRKLHGASRGAIGRIVSREFLVLIGVSSVLALPIAAIAIDHFLHGYLERAPFGVWPMVLAFSIALIVALLSTLRHTVSAMRMAPSRVLRG